MELYSPMISELLNKLDEINKENNLVWSYTHPDNVVAMSMGSG